MSVRIDHVQTSGTFSLDGGTWDVDNNIWLVGDDSEVVIIDAAHEADPIIEAVAGRRVTAIVLTHAHDDHVTVAPQLADRLDAPLMLHPADDELWRLTHPEVSYKPLQDGQQIGAGDATLTVIHTPGHSPGSCCLYLPHSGVLFSGDTLFNGGPGATGRSFSSFETIIESIRDRILTLDPETQVRTGHGDSTSVGAEAPHLDEWIARGS